MGKEYSPAYEETYTDNSCGWAYDGSGFGCGGFRWGMSQERTRTVPARYHLRLELACGDHRIIPVSQNRYDSVAVGEQVEVRLLWDPCP